MNFKDHIYNKKKNKKKTSFKNIPLINYDYNLNDLKKMIKNLNIKKGDNIFISSNISFFGLTNVNNKNEFGDASKLFEAISEDDLHTKISDTMNEMKDIFMNMGGDDTKTDVNDPSFNTVTGTEWPDL